MGKIKQFTINLNQNVYYPGQWIQGHVIVNLSQGMKMKGIQLELHGGAKVHWTEMRGKESEDYSAKETYINNKLILYGKFSDSTVHPAGCSTYPVRFQLPSTLPSSIERKKGAVRYWVRYWAECFINRPWKFNHKTKIAFTVASNLDLNRIPDVLTCPQEQNSKTLCCLCCTSGAIEAVVRLDRKGYVPGENILVSAEVTNGSSSKMDYTKAELFQIMTFHADTKLTVETACVAKLRKGVVRGGQSITWDNKAMLIPPLPASYLRGCNIIDIDYILKFAVGPSGPSFDLEVFLDVVIGGIPLQTNFTADAEQAPPYLPPSASPGASPPPYQAPVSGMVDEGDNEHMRGNINYAPIYGTTGNTN